MNRFVKPIALLGLAGAVTVGALATQAEARNGRWGGGAAAGFAAGAIIGGAAAAAANSNYYYNSGYYGGPAYAYEPGYAYAPAYDSYAYEPAYPAPAYRGYRYRDYGWSGGVNRRNDSYSIKQRHLDGTE